LMWVKAKWGCEVWVFISAYGPGSEKSEDERVRFWNRLSDCVRDVKARANVVVLGDLNARVGKDEIENVIGLHGVPGVNESGEHLVGLCMEHELMIGNTCFRKKDINKYTWVRVSNGRVIDRALMDYVIVSRSMRMRLLDVHVLRGEACGMSDHYLVEGRVKVCCKSWRRNERKQERNKVVKVSELQKERKMDEFQEKIMRRFECTEVNVSVEEEWKNFKSAVLESAREVCGMRVVGRKARKGSEWWNDVVKEAVEKKKRAYEVWLNCKTAEKYELYKEERKVVKWKVKMEKRKADERWGKKVSEKYEMNKKLFWKELKDVRKGSESLEVRVKDENGSVLCCEREVKERWKGYFDNLLNVMDEREANVVAIGNGCRMPLLNEVNDESISVEEVNRAVSEMKVGKAPGLDGCPAECIKKGGASMIEWIVRLFNLCFVCGVVPEEWCEACIVPLYKGKGDKYECSNYRGISLLSVVGKLYGRVLINRISGATECAIGDEQCGFRRGRGCVDQVFAVRQVCEKAIERGKEVAWAFMDLEKAYDRIDRSALWKVLCIYGVGGRLLRGVQSFYNASRACVRVANGVSEWFPVNVGLRQGCVMSPWLFNMYMDGVVREVNARVLGEGCELWKGNERMRLNQLLFADDAAIVADSVEKLQRIVVEFGRVCERRKLTVNVDKCKVMRCARIEQMDRMNIRLNGEVLEEVKMFKYLGSNVNASGDVQGEVVHRINEGQKVLGAVNRVFNNRKVGLNVKKCVYERVIVPTVLYGAETWGLREIERKKLNVFEMKCLRSMIGVTRRDRLRNVVVRDRTGMNVEMTGRVDERVLRWFGHMERMDDARLTKKVMNSRMSGNRPRGRPRYGWMDGVKRALSDRGMNVDDARICARDRHEWRAIVSA